MSGEENPAAEPAPVIDVQGDGRWMSQHNRFVQECKDAEPDVLFVGDSMVQLMQQFEVWKELFSPLHALNFGIGGDTTSNVLWRLQNGELENIRPRGLLPRGEFPNPLREKNTSVNNLLLASLPRLGPVQFLDMGGSFVHSDGTISSRDMFDFLHLTAGAYRTIATSLHELLLQLLEEMPQERRASLV
ncbi:platelet-activating factor acetylhydrolase IB subunit beta isoform X2 [Triplophysa rosa]|uniref:platelet-activating factor acetylhydrolase IB subunit beta isoform X2 n=1 Tax=Triplophysa rosa TaxID=992332 RepID=UPI0025461BF0|nr:platelet-activating factor acetylhydrolase IB subunit beta isoform X2 [Triplophysa rosa]